MIALSVYSTIEWIILSRWTITSTCSGRTPNRCTASITSKPLFISVAESIVIFAPIFQVGCASARAGVMSANCSRFIPKNGPPDAVSRIRLTSPRFSPRRHWKIAECSLSTGIISVLCSLAVRMTSSPAVTIDSLLASASRLPAFSAESVGSRPALCPMELYMRSASGSEAASSRASLPLRTSIGVSANLIFSSDAARSSLITTNVGFSCRACSSMIPTLRDPARASTCAPKSAATSTVCRPTEPVEPSITIFLSL